jgi:ribose 5-phosphate isomerase B
MRDSVISLLAQLGHEVIEVAGDEVGVVDYPDIAVPVAQRVSDGEVDRGILLGRTGVGMCIVANKFPGVRAANCFDDVMVETSRRHLDSNVLCLSGELLGEGLIEHLIRVWLDTPFDQGRHVSRLQKIAQAEEQAMGRSSRQRIASWRPQDSTEAGPVSPQPQWSGVVW